MKATLTRSQKRLTIPVRQVEGILGYDEDNLYPARLQDDVANSTMGRACLSLYQKFILGKGFADAALAAQVLNRRGEVANKVLSRIARTYGMHGGFALLIGYNAKYKISDIFHIPFAHVRRTSSKNKKHPNAFALSKCWGDRTIRREDIEYLDAFNPDPEVIQDQVERDGGWASYRGQLFYMCGEYDTYPLPIYDAALEDMKTDAQTKIFKYRNTTTNFMASHAVIMDTIESPQVENREGERPGGTETNTMVTDFEEYQGADNAMKLIIIQKTHPDQKIEFEKIDQQTGDKLYEYTEQSTRDNIRQAFTQPPVLLMQTPGKLGGASEIIDATKFYNSVTEDERTTLEAAFEYLSSLFERPLGTDFAIAPREAIRKEELSDKVLGTLTRNELRAMGGYEAIEDEADTQTLSEKIGVGGTTSLVEIVNSTTLSPEEKAGLLEVMFGLTPEQISKIIVEKDPPAPPAPAPPQPPPTPPAQ